MNVYRILGDYVGTSEARELAEQLVGWHDSMVKHLRVVGTHGGAACADDCPHDEAASLWSAAQSAFGARAADLAFLRSHGQSRRNNAVDHRHSGEDTFVIGSIDERGSHRMAEAQTAEPMASIADLR